MPITWTQTRDAIHAAIVSASGLAASKVVWGFQDVDERALDYVSMSLGASTTVGQDWIRANYDAGRPGNEFELSTQGTREVALQLQVFSSATVSATGAVDALERAERVKGCLRLPTTRALLDAVAVVPFDPGPVQYVPEVVQVGFRGRATLDVRCYMPAPVFAEYTTYIATISGTISVDGGAGPATEIDFEAEGP